MDPFRIFLAFLLLLPYSVNSLNILFFVPTLSHSHIAFNSKLAEILSKFGHRVTILLAQVDDTLSIGSHQNATSLPYQIVQKRVGVPRGYLRKVLWSNPGPYEDSSPINPKIIYKLLRVSTTFVDACQNIANDKLFLDDLRNQKFDVGLVEQYDSCGFGIFRAIGVNSTVWLSATALFRAQSEQFGVNLPYSYVPELFAPHSDEMSFFQKVVNILIGITTSSMLNIVAQARQTKIFQKLGYLPKNIDLNTLSRQSSSILVNSVPFFDYSMPMSSQISNIGGFSVQKDSNSLQLNQYWKRIADNSNNGFILVSFGGIARTMDLSKAMQRIFFSSFSKFPNITFIVKYETANASVPIPDNVILSPWIPQLPLMAHPNYRSIITHGGWSSILETTIHSRPMILMPLFADHAKNSKLAESKRVAILLDKMNLSQRDVENAIRRILIDKSFAENCKKFSKMFKDFPISHEKMIEWRIRQAAKPSTKKFEKYLKPKDYNSGYYVVFLSIFLIFCLHYCTDIFRFSNKR